MKKKIHRINWDKPDPYAFWQNTLFMRLVNPETKEKVTKACSAVIDLLRTFNLKNWESYLVVETLYKEFPKEEILKELKDETK